MRATPHLVESVDPTIGGDRAHQVILEFFQGVSVAGNVLEGTRSINPLGRENDPCELEGRYTCGKAFLTREMVCFQIIHA
jgi:hypothetical protein